MTARANIHKYEVGWLYQGEGCWCVHLKYTNQLAKNKTIMKWNWARKIASWFLQYKFVKLRGNAFIVWEKVKKNKTSVGRRFAFSPFHLICSPPKEKQIHVLSSSRYSRSLIDKVIQAPFVHHECLLSEVVLFSVFYGILHKYSILLN